MILKLSYTSAAEIPTGFESLYTETDGVFNFTGVEGMKTDADITRLQTSLTKERADHKAAKEKLALLNGADPMEIQTKLDRLEELELTAGKLDPGKIDETVEAKLRVKTLPLEREKALLQKQVDELKQSVSQYETANKTRLIQDAARAAISKQKGFLNEATDDVLLYAERMFEVTEDGKVLTRDNVGITPGVSAEVWLSDMQSKKAYWWGNSSGGGANGSNSTSGANGANPWSSANWNMTEQGRIYQENPQKAEQYAKAAGTTIGGARPNK